MNRLYQWCKAQASFFHSTTVGHGGSRTVRTEINEREDITVWAAGESVAYDVCPLCGQKLDPVQAEQAKLRLQTGETNAAQGHRVSESL